MRENFKIICYYCRIGALIYCHIYYKFVATKPTGVDGGWSEWSSWGGCSASCGIGIKSRSRTCSSPEPSGTGKSCIGKDAVTENCEEVKCPGT